MGLRGVALLRMSGSRMLDGTSKNGVFEGVGKGCKRPGKSFGFT